jgi:hypothetical protein
MLSEFSINTSYDKNIIDVWSHIESISTSYFLEKKEFFSQNFTPNENSAKYRDFEIFMDSIYFKIKEMIEPALSEKTGASYILDLIILNLFKELLDFLDNYTDQEKNEVFPSNNVSFESLYDDLVDKISMATNAIVKYISVDKRNDLEIHVTYIEDFIKNLIYKAKNHYIFDTKI